MNFEQSAKTDSNNASSFFGASPRSVKTYG